jgi:uncharacterized protein YbaP (TraB family)
MHDARTAETQRQTAAATVTLTTAAPDSGNRQLFWRAQKKNWPPLFFFGALHFGTPEMYPLPACVEDAFQACELIAFETDLAYIASPVFHATMAKAGRLPEGDSLAQSLTAETWQELCRYAQALGYHESSIEQLHSWYCASLLTSSALQRSGLASQLGIDSYLFARAKEQHKNILCLEKADEQLQLLSSIKVGDDEEFIQNTLSELANMPSFTQHMLQIWLRGDAAELGSFIQNSFESNKPLQQRMLRRRDRNWFQQLNAACHEGKIILSVVGAGHLVGEHSLLDLFGQHGYEIKQLGD